MRTDTRWCPSHFRAQNKIQKFAIEVCLVESPARDGDVGGVDAGSRLAVAVDTSVAVSESSVAETGVAKVGLCLSLPLAVVASKGGVASDDTSGSNGRGSDGGGSKDSSGVAGDGDVGSVDTGGGLADGNGSGVGGGGDGRGSDGGTSVSETKARVASSKEQGVSLSGDQGGGANLRKFRFYTKMI